MIGSTDPSRLSGDAATVGCVTANSLIPKAGDAKTQMTQRFGRDSSRLFTRARRPGPGRPALSSSSVPDPCSGFPATVSRNPCSGARNSLSTFAVPMLHGPSSQGARHTFLTPDQWLAASLRAAAGAGTDISIRASAFPQPRRDARRPEPPRRRAGGVDSCRFLRIFRALPAGRCGPPRSFVSSGMSGPGAADPPREGGPLAAGSLNRVSS